MIRILLQVGDSFLLQESAEDAITIGRATANHVVIRDPRVSRLHARIERAGDGVQVVDLVSANGTRLNGERIESDRLQIGDVLRIGPACLRVLEVDVSARRPTTRLRRASLRGRRRQFSLV
jgi:pSer/pThr/pTyr-binding forkhead associated (FHA) protein